MRTLYLDCFSGISGDMFVGAMLDLGVKLDDLRSELARLKLDGFELAVSRVDRSGISATKFDVIVGESRRHDHENEEPAHGHSHSHSYSHSHSHSHSHSPGHEPEDAAAVSGNPAFRGLSEIEHLIEASDLKGSVKARSIAIFRKLGQAESKIHNVPIESIHFHEVGAVDSIVDIVGGSICLDLLGVDQVVSSALKLGTGNFKCAHGVYPVPGPATAELLKDIPTFAGEVEGEMVTPTGAAIVATIASSFGPQPQLSIQSIGYGAGTRDTIDHPNVLRAMLGVEAGAPDSETVIVIETNIDDMSPQLYGHVMDQLFAAGALDVFFTAIQMKKNRPGNLITVIARPEDKERMVSTLFAETTTLGCRFNTEAREILRREHAEVSTRFGAIRIKLGLLSDGTIRGFTPEFEDCREAALRSGVSVKEVQAEAINAYLKQRGT